MKKFFFKKTTFLTFLIISFFTLNNVSAESSAVVVSNVSIFNPKIEDKLDNKYQVSFQLYNSTGIESGINYAISITDKEKVEYYFGEGPVSIGQGEYKNFRKDVEIPNYMLGKDINVSVLVKNISGLSLGSYTFDEITTKSINNSGFLSVLDCFVQPQESKDLYPHDKGIDVLPSESMNIFCPVKNLSKSKVNITGAEMQVFERSFFNQKIKDISSNFSMSIDPGQTATATFVIAPETKPQAYHVLLKLKTEEAVETNTSHFQYVTSGRSGTIQNLKLDKQNYNKDAIARVFYVWSGDAGNFPGSRYGAGLNVYKLKFNLYDSDGIDCGNKVVELSTTNYKYIEIPVTIQCNNAKVVAEMLDVNSGNSLYTATVDSKGTQNNPDLDSMSSLHVASVQDSYIKSFPNGDPEVNTNWKYILFACGILVLLGIIYYARTGVGVNKGIVAGFIFLSIFGLSTEKGKADTIMFSDEGASYYGCVSGDEYNGCTTYGWVFTRLNNYTASISLSKAVYDKNLGESVGSTMGLYSAWLGCSNVCDCYIKTRFNINLTIKNSAGSTVATTNSWKNRILCDEQWKDGRPSADCASIGVSSNTIDGSDDTYTDLKVNANKFSILVEKVAGFFFDKALAASSASYSGDVVYSNVSSLPVGSYVAQFDIQTSTDRGTGVVSGGTISLPFTVINAAPPVVNIRFAQ